MSNSQEPPRKVPAQSMNRKVLSPSEKHRFMLWLLHALGVFQTDKDRNVGAQDTGTASKQVAPRNSTKVPREKRKMLTISRIDPKLLQEIKERAKAKGVHLHLYCNQLLKDGLIMDILIEKRRRKPGGVFRNSHD